MAPPSATSKLEELARALRLASVPVGVALFFGMLLLPRAGQADSVPIPIPSPLALAREAAADHARAEAARRDPLPGAVRALGSAIGEFHRLEPQREDRVMVKARAAVDDALVQALPGGDEPLLRLRAVQLEEFVDEVQAFERSGTESRELTELGGNFVRAMQNEGYCHDHTFEAGNAALVAMFKQMWNAFLGLDARPAFELSLDERRALYALYLSHATPAPAAREGLESARRGARDENACDEVREAETAAIEARRLERIARLATFDPEYPAAYARGVANLRRHRYAAAAEALRTWLRDHPEGPLTLRAQTFLREALHGERGE